MSRAASQPASFVYLASRRTGGRAIGVKRVRNERALAEALRRDKLVLLRSWRVPLPAGPERPLSLKDQAQINEQLGALLSRGVPLVEAMEVVASVVGPAARPRIEEMNRQVAGGRSFADAARQAGGFDAVTVAVYHAAERTGDLAGAADQLARTAKRRLAVSGKAATLLIYPAIVLTISVLVGVLMLTVIVPRVLSSLDEMGVALPGYSRVMLVTGTFLRDNALESAAVASGLLVAAVLLRKPILGALGSVVRRLPLVGGVLLAQESARFFAVMAAMSRSGIPLADALGSASGAVSHPLLRSQLDRLRTRLVDGGVLRSLIDEVTALPLATRKLLVAADRAGDLGSAFESLAEDLADEVDTQSARLLAALEPLLIVGMFLLIGGMVLSIMVPMINASSGAGLQ
ncbi:MAG: type II secretion system F family protein [Planctomycetota bacterium]